jgi:hypothetical protein
MRNIEMLGVAALVAGIAAAIGAAYSFQGEETAGPIILIIGAGLYFAPAYVPLMAGNLSSDVGPAALAEVSRAGIVPALVGFVMIGIEVVQRVRLRSTVGTKADHLKYGKGIKEEKDVRNVFMGKCWQLPYCRKFVRERCPIYHSRRTCWRERVGCMCEEKVIQNAMAGKVIPSDVVAAAKYIPYNQKLPMEVKVQRCRQCVIYNEHQKHKYKLMLPTLVLVFVLFYILFRTPMLAATESVIVAMDSAIAGITYSRADLVDSEAAVPYAEVFLVTLMLIIFAYALKGLEFFIFKLKM